MRGLQNDRNARVVIAGHALIQNLRRSHDELGLDAPPAMRLAAAFTELAAAI
jgi:IS6 family transposase